MRPRVEGISASELAVLGELLASYIITMPYLSGLGYSLLIDRGCDPTVVDKLLRDRFIRYEDNAFERGGRHNSKLFLSQFGILTCLKHHLKMYEAMSEKGSTSVGRAKRIIIHFTSLLGTGESPRFNKGGFYDSSLWTGVPLDVTNRDRLIASIKSSLEALDSLKLSNAKKAEIGSLLCIAIELCELPEPPLGLVKSIFQHIDRIINISGFLIGAISLIISLGM